MQGVRILIKMYNTTEYRLTVSQSNLSQSTVAASPLSGITTTGIPRTMLPNPTFSEKSTLEGTSATIGARIPDEVTTMDHISLSNAVSKETMNSTSLYFEDTTTEFDNFTASYDNSTQLDLAQLLTENLWVPLSLSLFLIIVAGLLLNSATLFMFYRNKLPRNGSNQLILSFTCSDLVVTAVAYPALLTALLFGSWPFGLTGCKIYLYVFFLLGSASNNSRTAIAVDRYYTVTQSQQSAEVLRRQAMHGLGGAWVGAILATLPLLFGWSRIHLDNDNSLCAPDWLSTNIADQAYPIFYSVIGLAVPYVIKAACYYQVYQRVHRVARNIRHPRISSWPLANTSHSSISNKSSGQNNAAVNTVNNPRRMSAVSAKSAVSAFSAQGTTTTLSDNHNTQSRQLTKTLVLIVMSSLLSWGPYAIILIALTLSNAVTPNTVIIASVIAKSCVMYDPLVYVAFNKKFRKDYIRVMRFNAYSQNPVNQSARPRASSAVGDVPQNAGPHTRALHRYSNSKRFSVPMLSTINELESKYYVTHTSGTDSPDLLAQSHAQRPNAKCSLPESEIRKAQELMKNKNPKDNRDMMKYLKKSRPQRQSVVQKPTADLDDDDFAENPGISSAAPKQIRVLPAQRGKKPPPIQPQPVGAGRKISTYHGPATNMTRQNPPARNTSCPPIAKKGPGNANGTIRRGSLHRGSRGSIDSFSSILSIISQNL